MHVDWKLVDRSETPTFVALRFQRVRWVREVDDDARPVIECEFDHPEAETQEMAGVMMLTEPTEIAARFEIGKTYRSTFG